MGYCPFFLSLSHSTASCIVTHGLTGMAWETDLGAQQGRAGTQKGSVEACMVGHDTAHDMAKGGHDTTNNARSRGLAGGECVTIQSLYRDRSEGLAGLGWVTIQSIVS